MGTTINTCTRYGYAKDTCLANFLTYVDTVYFCTLSKIIIETIDSAVFDHLPISLEYLLTTFVGTWIVGLLRSSETCLNPTFESLNTV